MALVRKLPMCLIVLLLLGAAAAPGAEDREPPPPRQLRGPDGAPIPFADPREILDFLASAAVVERKELPVGITRPLKLTLERDGVRLHAVFRTVDERRNRHNTNRVVVIKFRDWYAHEVAAFRLDRLLGLDLVPPTVLRRLGRRGSVQLWIEEASTEFDRRRKGAEGPPHLLEWVRQFQTMRVFDALIDNFDRNQGNILRDPDWNVWLIDHTRSFTVHRELREPQRVATCPRPLFDRLREITDAELRGAVDDLLEPPQVEALLRRRVLLVEHFRRLIADQGEGRVLFDPADPGTGEAAEVTPGWDDVPASSPYDEPLEKP